MAMAIRADDIFASASGEWARERETALCAARAFVDKHFPGLGLGERKEAAFEVEDMFAAFMESSASGGALGAINELSRLLSLRNKEAVGAQDILVDDMSSSAESRVAARSVQLRALYMIWVCEAMRAEIKARRNKINGWGLKR